MAPSQNFAVINYAVYEKGFDAKLGGMSKGLMLLSLNWLHPSWRAGWVDAGKAAHLHPELRRQAAQRAHMKKGTK